MGSLINIAGLRQSRVMTLALQPLKLPGLGHAEILPHPPFAANGPERRLVADSCGGSLDWARGACGPESRIKHYCGRLLCTNFKDQHPAALHSTPPLEWGQSDDLDRKQSLEARLHRKGAPRRSGMGQLGTGATCMHAMQGFTHAGRAVRSCRSQSKMGVRGE